MDGITMDANGLPINIGTVVRTDKTVTVPSKVGSVVEITFKGNDNTVLKIAGVQRLVPAEHVEVIGLSEFETILYNALSERKAYLTEDEIHELAKNLIQSLKDVGEEPTGE